MAASTSVERKRGNKLGFWFFRVAVRIFGLRGAYGLLYFVGLYYLAIDRAVVSASLAFARRRFPEHGALRRLLDVYLLFVSQGKNLIDRYAVASGYKGIHVEFKDREKFLAFLAGQSKGFILLTAHVGNWQVAMAELRRMGRTVHLMMRREDNAAVKESLQVDSEQEQVKVIFTDDSLGGVIEAMKAVNRGEIVSIMGDRTYGYSATGVSFLGSEVRFPHGAFSLAAAAQCPVVVLLSARTGMKQYLVDVSHVIAAPVGRRGKKSEAMQAAVQEFANVLEGYVADYPYQWFVFRDIWKSNE
jgi:predicted LPLAT superfamily acyltransferase